VERNGSLGCCSWCPSLYDAASLLDMTLHHFYGDATRLTKDGNGDAARSPI
jgi:hypothetical protein